MGQNASEPLNAEDLGTAREVVSLLRSGSIAPREVIAAMRAARQWLQVRISTVVGLLCGGTQRTALLIMQPQSFIPSSACPA